MGKAEDVAGPGAASQQGFNSKIHTAVAEVTQEGVAGAEGKKGEGGTLAFVHGKNTIDNLVRRSISANGDEFPIAPSISFADQQRRLAGAAGFGHLQIDPARAQAVERRSDQFAA